MEKGLVSRLSPCNSWLPVMGMLRTVQLEARLPDRFVRRAA